MRAIGLIVLLGMILFSCQEIEKKEFTDWYKAPTNIKSEGTESSKLFYSKTLLIDTIYRSMQGPYEVKNIQLETENEELLWIVGYETNVIEKDLNQKSNAGYMCHNNLNYANEENIPWRIKTTGKNSRIFTLSEGQTNLELPEGYGIPVLNGQEFEMVSQVLNHNQPELNIEVKHQSQIKYIKGSQAADLKPLYQKSTFVTKQITGPAGEYGLPLTCVAHQLDSAHIEGEKPNHNCEIDYSKSEYDPYSDKYGRKYTSHWAIPVGEEILKTDVTQMMELSEDTKIHMIGVHLHPFGKKLELWDKTKNELLYESSLAPLDSLIGFKSIEYYKSVEGIPVFKDHSYELISTYNCLDTTDRHTAMAVMYLYLEDR
jgi:hypothetical protein